MAAFLRRGPLRASGLAPRHCELTASARGGLLRDLSAGLGSFRAVTFAASFHWMDRPRVALVPGR